MIDDMLSLLRRKAGANCWLNTFKAIRCMVLSVIGIYVNVLIQKTRELSSRVSDDGCYVVGGVSFVSAPVPWNAKEPLANVPRDPRTSHVLTMAEPVSP